MPTLIKPFRHPLTEKEIQRFWKYVQKPEDPDACWIWIGLRDRKGYGRLSIGNTRTGRVVKFAARISWLIHTGKDPFPYEVLHNCPSKDNPACVNIRHLYLGTNADNLRDRIAKRQLKNRLTDEQVLEVRALRESGMTYKKIAERYPAVHWSTIWYIAKRKIRKHV
jgi:hypothetical protein